MDLLDLMLEHDQWATAELLKASSVLSEADLDAPFDLGHRTVRDSFGHMIFNLPFWTAFLNGESPAESYSADEQPEDRSLAALQAHHQRTYALFAEAARRVRDEGRLGEIFTDHYGVRKTFGGTILMMIEHNEGHRTEIVHMLTRLGVRDVPEVDLGVWEYYRLNT